MASFSNILLTEAENIIARSRELNIKFLTFEKISPIDIANDESSSLLTCSAQCCYSSNCTATY